MLLAMYAFATVPLGKKTGLEHVKRILGTREAQEAGAELKQAGGRLVGELLDFKTGELRGVPDLPEELLPAPSQSLATPSLRAN